jgi:flagellar biosynthesis protein FliQ
MFLVLAVSLPWLVAQMTDYVVDLFNNIPGSL